MVWFALAGVLRVGCSIWLRCLLGCLLLGLLVRGCGFLALCFDVAGFWRCVLFVSLWLGVLIVFLFGW